MFEVIWEYWILRLVCPLRVSDSHYSQQSLLLGHKISLSLVSSIARMGFPPPNCFFWIFQRSTAASFAFTIPNAPSPIRLANLTTLEGGRRCLPKIRIFFVHCHVGKGKKVWLDADTFMKQKWLSLRNVSTYLERRVSARVRRWFFFRVCFPQPVEPPNSLHHQCIYSYSTIIWLIKLYSFILQCHSRPALQSSQ